MGKNALIKTAVHPGLRRRRGVVDEELVVVVLSHGIGAEEVRKVQAETSSAGTEANEKGAVTDGKGGERGGVDVGERGCRRGVSEQLKRIDRGGRTFSSSSSSSSRRQRVL